MKAGCERIQPARCRAHHFDEAHDFGGRKEVQANNVLRPACRRGELVHIEIGRIGRYHGVPRRDAGKFGHKAQLHRHVLEHRLDEEIAFGEAVEFAGQRQGIAFCTVGAAGCGLFQDVRDAFAGAIPRALVGIGEHDFEACRQQAPAIPEPIVPAPAMPILRHATGLDVLEFGQAAGLRSAKNTCRIAFD